MLLVINAHGANSLISCSWHVGMSVTSPTLILGASLNSINLVYLYVEKRTKRLIHSLIHLPEPLRDLVLTLGAAAQTRKRRITAKRLIEDVLLAWGACAARDVARNEELFRKMVAILDLECSIALSDPDKYFPLAKALAPFKSCGLPKTCVELIEKYLGYVPHSSSMEESISSL